MSFKKEKDSNKVWCPLRNIPCTHADADGLENCSQCEHFNLFDYMRWLENFQKELDKK